MRVKIFDDYNAMSVATADIIIDCLKNKSNALLCFATGNTPILTYKLLAEKVKQQQKPRVMITFYYRSCCVLSSKE